MLTVLCVFLFASALQTNIVHAEPCESVPYTFFYATSEVCSRKQCTTVTLNHCLENPVLKNVTVLFPVPELKHGAFQNMPNLEAINVSNANVEDVNSNAFLNLPNLETVVLKNNSLKYVRNSLFHLRGNIKNIDLSINYIEDIEDYAFSNMTLLRIVRIHNNRLSHLSSTWFENSRLVHTLILARNLLTTLDLNLLSWFNRLSYLDVSFNKIFQVTSTPTPTVINYMTFMGNNLEDVSFATDVKARGLHLGMNQITHIDVQNDYFSAKSTLYIHPNPWMCKCLTEFEAVMAKRRVNVARPFKDRQLSWGEEHPVCIESLSSKGKCDEYSEDDFRYVRQDYFSVMSYRARLNEDVYDTNFKNSNAQYITVPKKILPFNPFI